ncbi:hypothetical protein Belba_0625 [Belliella baltica DSM 15883]|uniref:DUF4382 domain-containing protein n=1 Tax=Belliella baltica (strain DSM 15883 / CIP 108006 / LMG 21964 / BA134) TaxID=866536 RepID=I3Z212_BELBD|nr:DUF4382 domain-containing protein [Belliella baltica]AFL83280.1 hypothetical protein Belba_0625 [Belliella baltica DSM 15883]
MKKIHILAFLLFSLFSCAGTEERSDALLNIFIVDAPADIDELWVEVLGVDVQISNPSNEDAPATIFLPYEAGIQFVDITQLIAGQEVLVGRSAVDVGVLTKITLRLGNENYLRKDGLRINLELPEANKSGLEIDTNFELRPGISHDIYIDFDLLRSLKAPEEPLESYEFNPKLSAFSKINTGEISGSIRPVPQDAFLYAIQQNDTVTTGVNLRGNGQGQFLFRGLEGIYTIYIIPKNDDYLADTIPTVIVQPQITTPLGNITLRPKEE